MPKDWKILQEIYHNTTEEYSDDIVREGEVQYRPEQVLEDCIFYLNSTEVVWLYPAKSYLVGVLYAKWLEEDFGEDFLEALDDPDLLYGNDPYFVPYSADTATYDAVIELLGAPIPMTGVVPDIRMYYEDEFMLNTET